MKQLVMAPLWRQNEPMLESRMNLRMPERLFADLDRLRKARPGRVSRNQWIIEAVSEKIVRDATPGDEER